MIYKTVQGVDVPALGLGTYLLTGRACRRSVAEAIDTGYRHIDTAAVYGNEKETGTGTARRRRRAGGHFPDDENMDG